MSENNTATVANFNITIAEIEDNKLSESNVPRTIKSKNIELTETTNNNTTDQNKKSNGTNVTINFDATDNKKINSIEFDLIDSNSGFNTYDNNVCKLILHIKSSDGQPAVETFEPFKGIINFNSTTNKVNITLHDAHVVTQTVPVTESSNNANNQLNSEQKSNDNLLNANNINMQSSDIDNEVNNIETNSGGRKAISKHKLFKKSNKNTIKSKKNKNTIKSKKNKNKTRKNKK